MQWYLRIAGAFELALYCLVKYQGNGHYEWGYENNTSRKVVLKYQQNKFELPIKKTVENLLNTGSCENYQVQGVQKNKEWSDFTRFYCHDGWELSKQQNKNFLFLRNDLYRKRSGGVRQLGR
jgi:hypothetical protein